MKIYIIHTEILPDDKQFNELTNDEVVAICNEDTNDGGFYHSEYDSVEELAAYWNTDEIFYPNMTYMRVIND